MDKKRKEDGFSIASWRRRYKRIRKIEEATYAEHSKYTSFIRDTDDLFLSISFLS